MKKQNELVGEEQNPNLIEKAVGKMMSGGKHIADAHPDYEIETGKTMVVHNLVVKQRRCMKRHAAI